MILCLLSNILLHPIVSLIPNFFLILINFFISFELTLMYFTQLNTNYLMLIFSILLLISNLILISIFIFSIYESFIILKNLKSKTSDQSKNDYLHQINQDEEEEEIEKEFQKQKRIKELKENKKVSIESPLFEIELQPVNNIIEEI